MSNRPNILMVMTDQQRFDTIGALGNALIRTPNLDRLCAEGTAFHRAYTPSPVCVPARCAVMTGLPPHLNGCTDNDAQPLNLPSFVEHLSAAGYQTRGVGKMHFKPDPLRLWGYAARDVSEEEADLAGNSDDYRAYLNDKGYGYVLEPHGVRSEYYYVPQPSQLPAEHHHTAWTADCCIDFLRNRDRTRPFFLSAHFIKPHPPFENPTPWDRLYRVPEVPAPFVPDNADDLLTYWNRVQNRYKYCDSGRDEYLQRLRIAAYYACISFIDYQLGRLLDELGEEIDNTLILFCSDHGELLGDYGSYGKRSMLDASCRIPLIARLPGVFPAGAIVERPATLLDIWPTCLALAGSKVPPPCDEGVDLAKLANGQTDREIVYSQFQQRGYAVYMAVTEQDKYIYSAPDRKHWYFNFGQTPRESHNLYDDPQYQNRIEALRNALYDRFRACRCRDAVDGQGWCYYPRVSFDLTRNEGLLFQDNPQLQSKINGLGVGYARTVTLSDGIALRLLSPMD